MGLHAPGGTFPRDNGVTPLPAPRVAESSGATGRRGVTSVGFLIIADVSETRPAEVSKIFGRVSKLLRFLAVFRN